MSKLLACVVLTAFLGSPSLLAQQGKRLRLGLGMSGIQYVGDLTEDALSLRRFEPVGSLSLQFDQQKRFWPQLNIGFGRMVEQADGLAFPDVQDVSPNRFVETSLFYTEFGLNVRIIRHGPVQPYLGAGVGLLFFQPKDQEGNFLAENIFTRQLDETYGSSTAYLPLTAGVVTRLGEHLSLGLSYTHKRTASDYLDNIGQLGGRAGNDHLHQIQFTVYLNLGPDAAPAKGPARLPEIHPVRVTTPTTAGSFPPQAAPNWEAWEATALLLRKFVYYEVQEGDALRELCQRFHLRPEVVRQINFMNNDFLAPGMWLRLPDVGQRLP